MQLGPPDRLLRGPSDMPNTAGQRGDGAVTPRALLSSHTGLENLAPAEGASGMQLIAGALAGLPLWCAE
jgi:hypothetical protein